MIGKRYFSLLLLCCLLNNSFALRCFVCGPDENCGKNYQLQTVNCGNNNPNLYNYQCVKYSIGDAVARGCFLDSFCREQPYCHGCDYDFCNGAILMSSSSLKLLSIVLTIVLLLSRRN